jgi:tRNA A-37 threonylcarbamoyl transferase component Bud32
MVIQHYTQDKTSFNDIPISFPVSEYAHRELLTEFLARLPGKRLTPFQAIHLLHALAKGIDCIHQKGEYHGNLHLDNITVERHRLTFEFILLDMFHLGKPSSSSIGNDAVDLTRLFYEAWGG